MIVVFHFCILLFSGTKYNFTILIAAKDEYDKVTTKVSTANFKGVSSQKGISAGLYLFFKS